MAKDIRSALVGVVSEFHGKLIEVYSDAMQPESLRFLAGDALATVEVLFDELMRLEPDAPWWTGDSPRT